MQKIYPNTENVSKYTKCIQIQIMYPNKKKCVKNQNFAKKSRIFFNQA